jgi:hypothetical protein
MGSSVKRAAPGTQANSKRKAQSAKRQRGGRKHAGNSVNPQRESKIENRKSKIGLTGWT